MKMSDVFRLPVEAESGVDPYYVTKCKKLDLMDGQAQAAAHAINQHDALVAMNAELVEALSELLDAAGSVVNCAYTDYVTQDLEPARTGAIEVLTKAKELSQ